MERDAAEVEVRRRLRDVGARLSSLPDDGELLRLLQEAAKLLYRVNQREVDRIHSALIPVMRALIKKELLDHTDPGVKLAVASCLTTLIKIRAPDPPYDDDVMKDVLKLVVGVFCELDDVDCPSYGTRVSMLGTFARIRGCALLLDLDCNDLIRDMFHHFFRTVSNTHQEHVISYMETIMKFVIEDITDMEQDLIKDLASCLLQNVKKEEKETPPASFVLAERVIGLCHEKLKPVFIKLLQGAPITEYSNLVTSFLQDAIVAGDNNVGAFMHDMKEVVSPKSSTMMGKTIGQPADSGDELKPEIVQGTKEAPNSNKKALDGSIVGSRIKVRWPADEMFYNGLVKSFDASSETHEIVYDHGDVVRQSLKDEKWEFIAEEQDYNPDASPDMLEDRSDEESLGQPFQDVHKAASSHSFVIQEKYNTVLNEIGCISTETTGSLLVRIQPRIVEALQLNQKRPAMKVQPRIVEESQLNHNRHDGMVGRDVFLKRIVRPYNRVARATIQSQDPLEMVGGTMLGRECYKVVIDSLICGDAELFRPHRNLNYIRDAIGHCIAWPSQLVCSFLGFFVLLLSLHSKSNMVNINLKG
uniref:Transposase Tnp1/En/Spm-like domain-containing protein n=1 Tax=Oryza glumipatula TaxID=40148 RepID=A0A0D9ZIY7_9ORYZ